MPVLLGELFVGPPVQLNAAPDGPDGKVKSMYGTLKFEQYGQP